MIWCGTSLSTLSKSNKDDGRVIIKGSVQWSAVQSRVEFHLQWDSNQGPHDPRSEMLTTLSPRHFSLYGKRLKISKTLLYTILAQNFPFKQLCLRILSGMAISVDPDQTAPSWSNLIWVCTACRCHFVCKFGVQNFRKFTAPRTVEQTGPEVTEFFSCLTQLSMKTSLLINKQMPTCSSIFSTNFMLSWVQHEKSFITSSSNTYGE